MRVVFSTYNNEVYVHLFLRDMEREVNFATEDDLRRDIEARAPVEFIQGRQWTFKAESLESFCEKYQLMLETADVKFHKKPPLPIGKNQTSVAYQLVRRDNDPNGQEILWRISGITARMYDLW